MENENKIILNDEAGNEVAFEFLDLIEYSGSEYVVLLPDVPEEEFDGEVVILQVDESEDSDEESYTSVDDADVLNAVFDIFKRKFQAEFDFAE